MTIKTASKRMRPGRRRSAEAEQVPAGGNWKNSLETDTPREDFQMRTMQLKISPSQRGVEVQRRNYI